MEPNWKRNGYHSKGDAMLKAIGDVLLGVPNVTLSYGNSIYTNVKPSKEETAKARYCPKHNKIQMGSKYLCGCAL